MGLKLFKTKSFVVAFDKVLLPEKLPATANAKTMTVPMHNNKMNVFIQVCRDSMKFLTNDPLKDVLREPKRTRLFPNPAHYARILTPRPRLSPWPLITTHCDKLRNKPGGRFAFIFKAQRKKKSRGLKSPKNHFATGREGFSKISGLIPSHDLCGGNINLLDVRRFREQILPFCHQRRGNRPRKMRLAS